MTEKYERTTKVFAIAGLDKVATDKLRTLCADENHNQIKKQNLITYG